MAKLANAPVLQTGGLLTLWVRIPLPCRIPHLTTPEKTLCCALNE